MKHWHFYDPESGLFSTATFSSNDPDMLDANTPSGMHALEGEFDFLSQRVNPETGEVIDYQPPQPSEEHEWNADIKRWVLKSSIIARNQRRVAAKSSIEQLEAKQMRAMRELALDPNNEPAKNRIAAIDAEIADLRKDLA